MGNKLYFIPGDDLSAFIKNMLGKNKVIGPQAKQSKFVFGEITSSEQLRLDYDVTLLPPKKALFPPRQNLIKFDGKHASSCIEPVSQILFGVHFYDIKAIDMLDFLFTDGHKDRNYTAVREATTIVGSSVQTIAKHAFFGTVGRHAFPQGHDAFLTKLESGYTFEVRSPRGEKLLAYGNFVEATDQQQEECELVNHQINQNCPEKLEYSSEHISEKTRKAFKNDALWETLAKNCFGCGACNIVCPTCYCFDVQDEWDLDQIGSTRFRTWDGCMLEDFSKVSLGNHLEEDFRPRLAHRFRHRMMRKTTYLNDKLGGPACVGCGRCTTECVPDIANPVTIIHKIMEAKND